MTAVACVAIPLLREAAEKITTSIGSTRPTG
jgi:hypothetical protein